MKGPLARIRRRKAPATAPGGEQPTTVLGPPAPPAQEPPPAPPPGQSSLFGGTAVQPPPAEPATLGVPGVQLPADTKPEELGKPGFRDRGRLRRRLRYLRRVRELGFRDLGGLVFDLDRFGRQGEHLVRGKIAALRAVDNELRALERALDERRDVLELREPGIAACPKCGALHGSDARFCPSCGVGLRGPRAVSEVANIALVPQGAAPAPVPRTPASEQPTAPQPATQQPPIAPPPAAQPPQQAAPEPPQQAPPEPPQQATPEPRTEAATEPEPPATPEPGAELQWEQPPPAPPEDRPHGEALSWEEQPTEVLRPSDQPDGAERQQ